MTTWTSDELQKIATAEELKVASLRAAGTLRKSTPIWVVRVGDTLYVRSVNGPRQHGFGLRRFATKVASGQAASRKN